MLHLLKSLGLGGLAIAMVSASALPETGSTLAKRATFDFAFRFYNDPNCNHNDNPATEYPHGGAALGGDIGQCYDAPVGVNWQRLETDIGGGPHGLQTFCDVGCQGAASVPQSGNCFVAPSSCAVGSFRMG